MKKVISMILIICIIAGLMVFGFAACKNTARKYDNAKKYTTGNAEYNPSDVASLNVAWEKGTVTIIASDEYNTISVVENNSQTETKYLLHRYLDKKGVLWIKAFESGISDEDLDIEWEYKDLTITMPKKALNEFYAEQHSKALTINGVVARSFETYNVGSQTNAFDITVTNSLNMVSQGLSGGIQARGLITGDVAISAAGSAHLYLPNPAYVPSNVTLSGKGYVSLSVEEHIGFRATYSKSAAAFKLITDLEGLQEITSAEDQATGGSVYKNGAMNVAINVTTKNGYLGNADQHTIGLFKYVEEDSSQITD